METLSIDIQSDATLLGRKYKEADGILDAGELDFRDFSSDLVRKVLYLQREFSNKETLKKYDQEEVDNFRSMARHFLTELKDKTLTEGQRKDLTKQLKTRFPKVKVPAGKKA